MISDIWESFAQSAGKHRGQSKQLQKEPEALQEVSFEQSWKMRRYLPDKQGGHTISRGHTYVNVSWKGTFDPLNPFFNKTFFNKTAWSIGQ